ncbi:MAG: MFS transporter [Gemmatimonadaceae bacterium]
MSSPNAQSTPSRARYTVVFFALALAMVTYIDRVAISQASGDIRRDLGFGPKEMGWVFSAFTIAYALFEIPGGWLGDRIGPRRVLLRVVSMWSLFTAATGLTWNLASMLVCRFCFGAGEAGCFPNLTKVFTIWLPSDERPRAQGVLWLSARWGGAFTPALVALILHFLNWRWAFALFGLLGVVWAVAFANWFRDRPADHPAVNAAELALLDGAERNAPAHAAVPWKRFVSSPSVWLLWLQYAGLSYGWYFYITWLPTYLREARGMPLEKSAVLAGLPLFFGGIGCFVGGWIARRLGRTAVGVGSARKSVAALGMLGAGLLILTVSHVESPMFAIFILGLASFSNDLAIANAWAACMDVGGRYAGSLSGSMNMMGNVGGAIGAVVVGYILESGRVSADAIPSLGSWSTAFTVAAVVYGVAAVAWLMLDPVTSLDSTSAESAA